MVLVDTSAWILSLRRDFHPGIKDRIDRILARDEVAVNGIVKLELLGGTKSKAEYKRLKDRLDSLVYLGAPEQLWDSSSRLAFDLRRHGVTLPYTDIFIAASAIDAGAVLAHADAHFDMIAEHSELSVESFAGEIQKEH